MKSLEITELFVEESLDLLSDVDQLILRLEDEPIDPLVIDSVFRKIHSVKGGAGAIPTCQLVASLLHEFESVLALIKKGIFSPNAEDINHFLFTVDLAQKLIAMVRAKEEPLAEMYLSVDSLVQTLQMIKTRKDDAPELSNGKPSSVRDEAVLRPAKELAEEVTSEDEGVMVLNDRLDAFMGLSGELIVLKNYFQMMARDPEMRVNQKVFEKKMTEFSYSLNKITDSLQEQIVSVRKVLLSRSFGKLPRIVRKTSQDLGKKVSLRQEGLDLGVDKSIAKSLSMCLTHMIRNSIDHGIEAPEVRVERGKPKEGHIVVRAMESQGIIQVVVSDDGGGIPKEKVLKKAIQNGLISEDKARYLSDAEIFDLIFLPGFSTADQISDVSGRGVGMDAVKQAVLNHKGRIRVESELFIGSRFIIEIPVAKAVMVEQTVLTRNAETMFAIPLVSISRIISCDQLSFTTVNQTRTCQFEGQTVPLRTYDEFLKGREALDSKEIRRKTVVFMSHRSRSFGLIVDAIEDQLEAVIRPFDNVVRTLPGFKGTTVLGNESIAYIVSPEQMFEFIKDKRFEMAG